MSLQEMALFDAISAPHSPHRDEWMKDAVRINADSAAKIYYHTDREDWRNDADFPPLRAAYPSMWIEYVLPRHMRYKGAWVESGAAGWNGGSHVTETPESWGTTLRFHHYGVHRPTGEVQTLPVYTQIGVNREGRALDDRTWFKPMRDDVTDAEVKDDSGPAGLFTQVAMLAIGLMHCRNVTTVTSSFRPRHASGKNRKRVPVLDYRTIVLPGQETTHRGHQKASDTTEEQPLHQVRGHFKTFTEEKPMLGKHVGTYWWGWQVRGNKRSGIVTADYRLAR